MPHSFLGSLEGAPLRLVPGVMETLQYLSDDKPCLALCTTTSLTHIGDPTTPTYLPANTPLDHWLLRLPAPASHRHEDTLITTQNTKYSDHCALTATIPQIGDSPTQNLPTTTPIPTTRSHPPFILPIPKQLIDLYKPLPQTHITLPTN